MPKGSNTIPNATILNGRDSTGKKQTLGVESDGHANVKDMNQRELLEQILLEMRKQTLLISMLADETVSDEEA